MAASAPVLGDINSAPSRLSKWIRQGVESFVAAQKILLDLTAQQNALAMGVIRERLTIPKVSPGAMLVGMANQGVTGVTEAGNILLDFAAGETGLLTDAVKTAFRLGPWTGAVADIARHRVETFIEMHRRLLTAVSEQMTAITESYDEGKGLMGGASAGELARHAVEAFMQTEEKFLDLVVEEVGAAAEGGHERKPARDRSKMLMKLAHEAADKYIDAQKRMLDLVIHQFDAERKAAGKLTEDMADGEPQTPLAEVTEKGVKNFVEAEKSFLHLMKRPERKAHTTVRRKQPRRNKAAEKTARA